MSLIVISLGKPIIITVSFLTVYTISPIIPLLELVRYYLIAADYIIVTYLYTHDCVLPWCAYV